MHDNDQNETKISKQPKSEVIILEDIEKNEAFTGVELNQQEILSMCVELDPISALEKLRNFQSLISYEKICYTRHLVELLEIIGKDGIQELSGILIQYDDEPVEILKLFIQQLPGIFQYIVQFSQTSFENINQIGVPVLKKLLQHKNFDIKTESGQIFFKLLEFYNSKELFIKQMLKFIIELSHSESSGEDEIIITIQILSKLAECIQKTLIESIIVPEIIEFSEDLHIRVRKEIAYYIGNFACKIGKQTLQTKIIPVFLKLADDQI